MVHQAANKLFHKKRVSARAIMNKAFQACESRV